MGRGRQEWRVTRIVTHVEDSKPPGWEAGLDWVEVRTFRNKPEQEVRRAPAWRCGEQHIQLTEADACATKALESGAWAGDHR